MLSNVSISKLQSELGKIPLIDVREPNEFNYGHVPTAKNIPLQLLLSNPKNYLKMGITYYIVCQSGTRSLRACETLSSLGFNVVNVIEGTSGYRGTLEY